MASQDFGFSKFSSNEFYSALNARLVDMAVVGSEQRIVDLACGTGGVTQLILERLIGARDSMVIGIDQSAAALKQAMDDLVGAYGAAVDFCPQRRGEVFRGGERVRGHGILLQRHTLYARQGHDRTGDFEVAEAGRQVRLQHLVLRRRPAPESLGFYRKWMFKSARVLRRDYGLSPVRSEKVESRRRLTADQYRELLEGHGFMVVRQEIDTVNVPIEGWLDISDFEDFIVGTMPGVPLDKASAALKRGVHQTFEEMQLEYVPRNWLGIVAVRV